MKKITTVHCYPTVHETEKAVRDWGKSLMNSDTNYRSAKNPLRVETDDQVDYFVCVPVRLDVDRLRGISADEVDFSSVLTATSRQLLAIRERVVLGRRPTP